jgi:very-short-patch-repair endonuclease
MSDRRAILPLGRRGVGGMRAEELRCLQLAARQDGVLGRSQARELGLADRRISRRLANGRWRRLLPAVYAVEGAARTWRQELRAASLWAGRGFALSHRTAAALHGFARFREGPVELSLLRALEAPSGVVVHQAASLPPKDLASAEGFRVTSVTRTLVDLCALNDEALVRATFDEALRRRKTTLDRLQVAVSRSPYRPGIGLLRALLEEQLGGSGPTESELEVRVVELLELAGLPRPWRQRTIEVGGRVRRMDFRIPGTPVVIEADGYAYHANLGVFEADRVRNNQLTARGLRVLHWTWAGVRDRPAELLEELRMTLALPTSGPRAR